MWYVGLDVGGTHIDLVALSPDGMRSEAHHMRPTDQLPEHIAPQFVDQFIKDLKIERKSLQVIGVGWKHGRNKERSIAMVQSFAKHKMRADVLWDAESAFEGALPGQAGIVVACGTGAVVYGKTPRGKAIFSGGWSPLLGDPGSAFAIGRKAFVAALRSSDGSGAATKLLGRIPQVLHMPLEKMVVLADAHMDRAVPLLASLCPAVFELADSGDAEALRIRDQAAAAIAERIASLLRLWPSGDQAVLSYAGRLMHAQSSYRDLILSHLHHSGISIGWREPQFRPPYGAVLAVHPKLLKVLTKADQTLDWHH